MSVGQIFLARRQEMGLSLSALSKEIGGSPNESFLAKIERGEVTPSLSAAERLAKGLRLPLELVINAAGHATDDQVQAATRELISKVGSPHPVLRAIPYRSPEVRRGSIGRRQVMLKATDEAFVIDLADRDPETGRYVNALLRELFQPFMVREDRSVAVMLKPEYEHWRMEPKRYLTRVV